MRLVDINKSFISEASKSVVDSSLPIKAINNQNNPIIAIEKWKLDGSGFLTKSYMFENLDDRNRFIVSLLNYELENGHFANIEFFGRNIVIKLKTKDVDQVTELDKSYAKYSDIIRKDIAYNS